MAVLCTFITAAVMRRYGFSSCAAADEFKRRPQEYLQAAHALLLDHPHIIPLVGQVNDSMPPLLDRVMNMGYHILRLDYSTQTPTHFVEQHIDGRSDAITGLRWPAPLAWVETVASCAGINGINGLYEGKHWFWLICKQR